MVATTIDAAALLSMITTPAVDLLTLAVIVISGYFAYRQRTTSYSEVKRLLVAAHVFFGGVIILEILRSFLQTAQFIELYVSLGTTFILAIVELLIVIAWAVYLRDHKAGLGNLFRDILSRRVHAIVFLGGTGSIVFVNAYLFAFTPYKIELVSGVLTNVFNTTFEILLLIVLLLFMAYPTTIFMLARRKTKQPQIRRALLILPLTWIGIGLDLLIFNAYSISAGFDSLSIGYLIAAIGTGITASIFRRASLLVGFFEPGKITSTTLAQPDSNPVSSFSKHLGLEGAPFAGRKYLLEVDPSASFERGVRNFALELISKKQLVFAFTTKGSPIFNALHDIGTIRFYIMTSSVSYPTIADVANEILIPQNDNAILIDTLQRTVDSDPSASMGIIFDNLTDQVLLLGLESCYKFVKKAIEVIDSQRLTGVFLITSNALDARNVNLIRSLFANQVIYAQEGLKAKRLA